MQMLEKVERGWGWGVIVWGSKKENINIERPFPSEHFTPQFNLTHAHALRKSVLVVWKVSVPSAGMHSGCLESKQGNIFLPRREAKQVSSLSLHSVGQIESCAAQRQKILSGRFCCNSTGWIYYEVSFQTDTKSQSVLLLNCLTATASFPQVQNKPTTF